MTELMDSVGDKMSKPNRPLVCVLRVLMHLTPIAKEDYDYPIIKSHFQTYHEAECTFCEPTLGLTGPPEVLWILRYPR